VIIALLFACEDNDIEKIELANGTYNGTFYRTSPAADWMVSNVTLTLTDGSYTGESDIARYPAICRGTYTVSGQNVEFANACPWTAEFDWTFILSGNFKIASNDGEIILTRVYDANTIDTYKLKKQ
jgi:hypothetical protein